MADDVFSLKHLFTTAALALAIDLLFVFPISHYSAFGQSVAMGMAKTYGFVANNAVAAATSNGAAAASGAALTPVGTMY